MSNSREGWATMSDGKKLYEKVWEPSNSPPTAHLVFIHGFSDHSNAYYNFFPTLSSPPYSIAIHALDQRGWGRSVVKPAEKGLTGTTAQVLQDIHDYVQHVWSSVTSSDQTQNVPLMLMGHSMGGQECLHYLLNKSSPYLTTNPSNTSSTNPTISALLLESPYVALHPSSQPPPFVVTLGKLASKLLPSRQMVQQLSPDFMSRDPKVREDWVADELCHDTGTLQGLAGMLERAGQLDALGKSRSGAGVGVLNDTLPAGVRGLWLGHGTEDGVVGFEAAKRVFERVGFAGGEGNKGFKAYEGAYHKLHAEPDGVGEGFTRDVGEFVMAVVEEGKGGGSGQARREDGVGGGKPKL